MTDIQDLKQRVIGAGISAWENTPELSTEEGLAAVIHAALAELQSDVAFISREITDGQKLVLGRACADVLAKHGVAIDHDEAWYLTPQEAHVAYLDAGEVKIFGNDEA